MRKKVDSNEYSFFLKAKGETAVTVTIFRKDEKVVSKNLIVQMKASGIFLKRMKLEENNFL